MSWFVLALVGCGKLPDRGRAPVIPPEENALVGSDQVLPVGLVGERYEASLALEGGVGPYTFTSKEGEDGKNAWPVGLTLSSEGRLEGVPKQAGTFSVNVIGHDSEGRTKALLVGITIVLEPRTVRCGETVHGTFTDTSNGPEGVDLRQLDAIAWLAVEMPDDLTSRVELVFDNEIDSTVYVERPSELLGSWDLLNHYVGKTLEPGPDQRVKIDTGTDPSLSGYLAEPLLPMFLAGEEPGDWSMTVECSDGPIFVTLQQYPNELGLEFAVDFEVWGDNQGVTIHPEAIPSDTGDPGPPLPDWVNFDPATGTMTGIAQEAGSWVFDVVAETPDGRTRTERAIWGVYPVTELECGASAPIVVTEGYFDGDYTGYYDTNGYNVFRVPLGALDPDSGVNLGPFPSSVLLRVTGGDEHYVGLATPNPGLQNYYGGAERVYSGSGEDAVLVVDPQSYPATHHYVAPAALYFSGASTGLDVAGLVAEVQCDFSPLPDLAGLPVVDALVPVSFPLRAIGGEAPYTWSARGLPAGLELHRDGTLDGTTGALGEFDVHVVVEDKTGARGSGDWTLTVGTDAACRGHERVVCGQSIDGEFTDVFYSDGNGPASTRTLCFVHDEGSSAVGIELYSDDSAYRVDVADPAVDPSRLFEDQRTSTYVMYVDLGRVEGYTLDSTTWPRLDDYEHLPLFVSLRAYDPGGYTAHFVCGP